jgi:hypothetical protein
MSHLFPLFNGGRGPFPKQELIFDWTRSGEITGAGAVYQGGKGSAKTVTGAAWIIWMHHVEKWHGMRSLIGRETYPALVTSTADEFFMMVEGLPDRLVKAASKPSKNTMGYVEWSVGGVTLLCSLKDSNTWESANLGAAWVDEGHRQNPRVIGDLETRLRQQKAPRCMLITQNPGGQGWLWRWANPASPKYRKGWKWIEASTLENPALPPDYHQRLISRYGMNTPAYRRWVKGESSALEGTVFTELVTEVEHLMHVVPAFELPNEGFVWGRGLDYGMVNPTAVVWGAKDPWGNWWIDRLHYAPATPDESREWTVEQHCVEILDIDGDREIELYPADPSIWIQKENPSTGLVFSTFDQFDENGVTLSQANNNRESGLQAMLDLFAIDPEKSHPYSGRPGSPSIFILDRQENEPLLREMSRLLWAKPEGTSETGRPDDVQKREDHTYDALRYLIMESPAQDKIREEIVPDRSFQVVGARGRTRRY